MIKARSTDVSVYTFIIPELRISNALSVDCLLFPFQLANEGPESVCVKDILLELRNYRMGLIQTVDQLKFSYMAIVEGKDIPC